MPAAKKNRAYALNSTELEIDWEYELNVTRFTVLQGFYHDNFWDWLYPRSGLSFEGRPNSSLQVTGLQPNTTHYFYISLGCSNGVAAKNSEIISATTKP